MNRMKTFLKYVVILVLFYIISNILIDALFKVSYSEIKSYDIDVSEIYVDVTEAKVSKRNGYINGIVKNNTKNVVENKFLKISMLSENNNVLGEKYLKIDKLNINQLRKFEVKFDYNNVKTFKIELTDTMPEKENFIELIKTNVTDIISTVNVE